MCEEKNGNVTKKWKDWNMVARSLYDSHCHSKKEKRGGNLDI